LILEDDAILTDDFKRKLSGVMHRLEESEVAWGIASVGSAFAECKDVRECKKERSAKREVLEQLQMGIGTKGTTVDITPGADDTENYDVTFGDGPLKLGFKTIKVGQGRAQYEHTVTACAKDQVEAGDKLLSAGGKDLTDISKAAVVAFLKALPRPFAATFSTSWAVVAEPMNVVDLLEAQEPAKPVRDDELPPFEYEKIQTRGSRLYESGLGSLMR
jgi:hypothetical protein